ncbi:MAG: hypothetical protein ABIT37_20195 [Luteolibacter sp.]
MKFSTLYNVSEWNCYDSTPDRLAENPWNRLEIKQTPPVSDESLGAEPQHLPEMPGGYKIVT